VQIRFGDCVVDTETRQVLRRGEKVVLSPKAYRLLILLVEARPKVLTKEDLYRALWPDTFVVEANLSNLVGEIRGGLGDSAKQAGVIRTLHGYGYAFCAEADVRTGVAADPEVLGYLIKPDGRALPLREPHSVIGRGSDVHVRLDLPGISRHHARITIVDGHATVEDLQSKNGTFVRGERIVGAQTLMGGDELGLGSIRVSFHIASASKSTETTP
jgi:DNA-binding winged helix-turn-helix (wHTH) protein